MGGTGYTKDGSSNLLKALIELNSEMRSVVIISRSLYIKEAVSNTQTEKANWNDSFNSSLYQNLENKKEKKDVKNPQKFAALVQT